MNTKPGLINDIGEINELTDIATLFGRDPALNNDKDIDRIIDKMRSARHLFKKEGAVRKKAVPKLTKGQEAAKGLKIDLKLDL